MKNGFVSHHWSMEKDIPDGGVSYGTGFTISWQRRALRSEQNQEEMNSPNGAFIEDIIDAARDRLEYHQATRFSCLENQQAIEYLNKALEILNFRTQRRAEAKTLGTHELD